MVFLKRLVRPWVRLYTDQPLSRQAQINVYLHYVCHNLVREVVRLQIEHAALRNRLEPQPPAGRARPGAGGGSAGLKVGLVVQRYGTEVVGGAELHCRWVAEHLAERHRVEVLTSAATDYLSWHNVLPAGVSELNGVAVRRFPVARERRVERFDPVANKVCFAEHTDEEERQWLEEHGPVCPELVEYLRSPPGGVRRARLLLLPLLDDVLRLAGGPPQERPRAHRRARPRPLPAALPPLLPAPRRHRVQHPGGAGPHRAGDRERGPARRGGGHRASTARPSCPSTR